MASTKNEKHWGVLAEYDTPKALYEACEKVRDAGFKRWDAHTPFPVHGLDKAMGVKQSWLPWITLVVGLTGTLTAFILQYWVHAQTSICPPGIGCGYPLVISGKPLVALPAYVPIMFELSVLFAAFGTVFGMLGINKLPMWNHPLFEVPRFQRVTDDKFFISIEAVDPNFDGERTLRFLSDTGAGAVEYVEAA